MDTQIADNRVLDHVDIRWRIETRRPLCAHTHTIHRDCGNDTTDVHAACVWMSCDDPAGQRVLGRLTIPRTSNDESDAIRYFVTSTSAAHEAEVAGRIILNLLSHKDGTRAV